MIMQDLANVPTIAFLTALTFLWICWRFLRNDTSTYPPGPFPLPVIGNLHLFFGKDRRDVFDKLRARYGDIFTVYFGHKPFIVVCGYKFIKEVFQTNGESFMGRPKNIMGREEMKGLIRSQGRTWTEQRRFALSTLRDLGMGRNLLQTRILEEVNYLHTRLDKSAIQREPLDLRDITYSANANIINLMLYGHRFEYSDKHFQNLISNNRQILECAATVGIVDIFPLLKYFPGDLFKVKMMKNCTQNFRQIQKQLTANALAENEERTQDTFVSAYANHIKKVKDVPDTTFDEDQMLAVVSNLFSAATDTTYTVIMWIYLYLVNYPEVQQKMWEEVREQIGTERKPTMSDKQNMPYVQAAILEMLRHSDMGPVGIPRGTSQTTAIGKYVFPVGSHVLAYIHSISTDKQAWGDPQNFRPSRFLNDEGRFTKPEHAAFFFLGKRTCIGESFANMSLFLTVSSLLQRYELLPPDGEPIPALKGKFTLVHAPLPYRVQLKLRNSDSNTQQIA